MDVGAERTGTTSVDPGGTVALPSPVCTEEASGDLGVKGRGENRVFPRVIHKFLICLSVVLVTRVELKVPEHLARL